MPKNTFFEQVEWRAALQDARRRDPLNMISAHYFIKTLNNLDNLFSLKRVEKNTNFVYVVLVLVIIAKLQMIKVFSVILID